MKHFKPGDWLIPFVKIDVADKLKDKTWLSNAP